MNGARFDNLARKFTSRQSRRGLLVSATTMVLGVVEHQSRAGSPEAATAASVAPCVDHIFGSGSATGGHHVKFRVRISAPAPVGGAKITLTTSRSAITLPASVTVPSGETEMTFSASTHPVATDTTVIVTASAGACKVTRSVIVKAPVLRSLSVQTVIRGGGRGKITVCLTGATASGGAAVSLNSNRPSVLPVPSSVTIPTGKACLSIALNAATVRSDVPVTISARRVVKLSRPTIVRNFTTATPTPTQPSTPHDTPTNTPIDSPTSTAIDTPTNTPINTQTSTPTDTPTTTATTIASCGSGGPCTVFVTSTTHDGNLGGIAGGDNICQIRASAAGLPGSFRAWLSATGTDASSRFDASAGPYYLVNGTTIATDISDLIDGTLAAAIDCTESGNLFQTPVWTATQDDGSFSGQTCSNVGELPDWSTITGRTAVGSSMTTTTGWSFTSIQPCASSYALYCFQVE